jgi:hypothetical protein
VSTINLTPHRDVVMRALRLAAHWSIRCALAEIDQGAYADAADHLEDAIDRLRAMVALER